MLHHGFDSELLALHGRARVADLKASMRGARRDEIRFNRVRRWAGGRLIRIGLAIAAEPSQGTSSRQG